MINRNHIKDLSERIALEYSEYVTPLDKIIEDEGLSVFYDSYGRDTFDGMTIYDNGKFYIHINTDLGNKHNSPRGRFTLAHELGHIFYGHSNRKIDILEAQVEADKFAIELGFENEIESFLQGLPESLEKRVRLSYVTSYIFDRDI